MTTTLFEYLIIDSYDYISPVSPTVLKVFKLEEIYISNTN